MKKAPNCWRFLIFEVLFFVDEALLFARFDWLAVSTDWTGWELWTPLSAKEVGVSSGSWDEGANLFFVISNLDSLVVDDDRTAEDGRIVFDEGDELGDFHLVEVDVLFLNNLTSWGDDLIGSVDALRDDVTNLSFIKGTAEDIFAGIWDLLVIEPLLYFAAG